MTTPTAPAPSRTNSLLKGDSIQRLLALGALIILLVIFSVLVPHFASANNYIDILTATAVNGVLATGVTFVIITGGIDLSVGTAMTFTTVVMGLVSVSMGLPIWVGLIMALVSGMLVGFVNGSLIAYAKLPPFIATLGMLNITRGLAQVLSDVKPIYFDSDAVNLSNIFMAKPIFGIPNIVWVMFGGAALAWATRLSGVNVNKWKVIVYMTNGFFVGLAGIVVASRMNSAQPSVGSGYELDAIAAAVIGGTSLSGGEGSIVGTIIGAFIISTLQIGLSVWGVPDQWKLVITGLVVIGAVWLDILRRRNRS